MSFEVSLSSYFQGHVSGGVRRAMLQGLVPVSADSAKENTWLLHYGEQQCRVELKPSAYDSNTISSLHFSGECSDPALWNAILRIMQRENFVCSSEHGVLFVAKESVRAHLPADMQSAHVICDAEEILRAVHRNRAEAAAS
ncbi:MAG TPA: hypothetical protein VMU24_01860 [Candidatus Acidoferrales bacterium]|nr:hypothetical protein [Candidatus Acidoferrales bacterium]